MAWNCCSGCLCSSSSSTSISFSYSPFLNCCNSTKPICIAAKSATFRIRNNSSLALANLHSSNKFLPKFQQNFRTKATESEVEVRPFTKSTERKQEEEEIDCVGTGQDVECVVVPSTASSSKAFYDKFPESPEKFDLDSSLSSSSTTTSLVGLVEAVFEWGLLISPFFFWGTAMVAMKEVLPKTGPFFVSSFRLIPAGLLLGFLAEGLEKTSAGLGSVIIDSQPLTVAVLAALLFGESIGIVGASGLVLGVIGLLLLEVPAISFDEIDFSLWGSGEWWMLLAAQSMAVGTVMVRWVTKYSDPIMATGWHMVIGGIPLMAISILNHDPALSVGFKELSLNDLSALLYTSLFGSAISYGVYFYNATRGSLTKLSSLTFLTPMFASIFGFVYLGETFTPVQVVGALVTLAAIFMVNYKSAGEND